MPNERRYSLIDKHGIEESRAVTPAAFKREYEAKGYTLGFATDGNREPYSDAALNALEKGRRTLEQDAKARGIATFIGPEVPSPDGIAADVPKPKAEPKAKAEA